MKRIFFLTILVVLLASLVVQPVFAKSPIIKGEVTAIGSNSITVLTKNGQSVVIAPPADFDLSSIAVGDTIIAKGRSQGNGPFVADWVKKIGQGAVDDDTPEGGKAANPAFCDVGKKQEPHPIAAKLAGKYGVSTDWVMDYYCDGYSMGAIMLALNTNALTGANADDLLAQRSNGKGWGAIWQEQHIIGSEKDVNPPPGQLKKQTNTGH